MRLTNKRGNAGRRHTVQTTGLEVQTCWEEDVGRERNTHLQVKVSDDVQRQR
jgi:hypothetical protein